MGVADDIYSWKRQNVDRENVRPKIFNMCGAAADVEKRAIGTSGD
jgi:hypothetical protein